MNDDSHDFESVNISIEVLTSDIDKIQNTIGKLISRVEAIVNHFHGLDKKVDRLENKTEYSLKDLDERIDTIERNHRFMSYKLPDSLSAYYGHKLLPGLNPDDLKEDQIKHERSKYEDVIDDDLPDIKDKKDE